MRRRTSFRVATSPGKEGPSRWPEVERDFLQAMWEFDQNFARGEANQGDNQNGKGDFFTDLIALLLENCSEKPLFLKEPSHLDLDRVLHRVCTALRNLP